MSEAADSPVVTVHPVVYHWLRACDAPPAGLLECPVNTTADQADFHLVWDQGLALQPINIRASARPFRVDFTSGRNAHRRRFGGGRQQDLARACGLNKASSLTILDATAGFGRDAFALAALGAQVTLVEQQPVIWALLRDGLDRLMASSVDEERAIGHRMRLVYGQSGEGGIGVPMTDVIYLDPMFPARRKSAAVKLDMQILQRLADASPVGGEAGLLCWARAQAPLRVVVKRPRLASPLGGRSPSYCLTGKSNRFDIYAFRRIPTGG